METTLPAVVDAAPSSRHVDLIVAKQYLCLAVGKETYAVGIDMVREILEVGRMTPLPLTPEFVRGVMNLRGAVVPVIDLKARFGAPRAGAVDAGVVAASRSRRVRRRGAWVDDGGSRRRHRSAAAPQRSRRAQHRRRWNRAQPVMVAPTESMPNSTESHA